MQLLSKHGLIKFFKLFQTLADRIEPSETHTPTISDFENFLSKHSKVLHPNHVIMIDKKYTLAKMYGRMIGFEPGFLNLNYKHVEEFDLIQF